jgi:Biotin synthase and related enzymes
VINTDFLDLDTLKEKLTGDDCFFCIGTTHKDTPDKNEYRRIEYDLPVQLAKIAKFNSISNFIYVSSIGANPKASSTYLKNKGQVEEELKKIGFSNLSIIQPSFLVGNRKDFRIVEVLGIPVMKFLSLFFFGGFKKYTPIKVEIVVNAMIKLASGNNSEQTYLSDRLQELGSN